MKRRSYKNELRELQEKIKEYLIDQTGEDFWCEECGTELDIYETECFNCETVTTWSTDCQVREIIKW